MTPPGSSRNAVPGRRDLRARAGRVGREQPARRQVLALRLRRGLCPGAAVGGRDFFAFGLQHRRALHVGLRPVVDEHVVHDLAVAGADLDRLHPLRLGEVRRDVEVLGTRSVPSAGTL